MMKINRNKLVLDLAEFAQVDNGLLVGKPGIGKSYLLRQLMKSLKEKKMLSLIIRIDRMYEGTDRAIQEELEIKENWIEMLQNVENPTENKSILIFDAFDAARDEQLRKEILSQIKKAKLALKDKWNILVSVRSYDASKSPELMRLFPYSTYDEDSMYCRKFEVYELTEDEILEGIGDNEKLSGLYQTASSSLKEILKVPFFLKLLEEIVQHSDTEQLADIGQFKSETQLLERYWRIKIVNTHKHLEREQFLSVFTKLLVKSRKLSESKDLVFSTTSGVEQGVFTYLRSENIIDEVSINNTRLAYSHNILFDYAVSCYCLQADYDNLLLFIKEDKSRPFFLRPSFVFFFATLWHKERKIFWEFYWKLYTEDTKEIKLFLRLVLNGIVVSEFIHPSELQPIFDHQEEGTKVTVIRNLLQSIHFMRRKSEARDIDLLFELSNRLHGAFLFEYGFLLDRSLPDVTIEEKQKCGTCARALLSYVLEERKSGNKELYDRIGSTRGVELVARTYDTDINKSKELLVSLFALLQEPNFEIWYFSNLAEQVKNILPFDPLLVAEVYKSIFAHKETNEARTNIGASVIMNFTSNRRQDFEMCYFRLIEFFANFMSTAPKVALPVGMAIANNYIRYERHSWADFERTAVNFLYDDISCEYVMDLSSIWSDSIHYDKPAMLIDKVLAFIESLVDIDPIQRDFLIKDYIKHASSGYSWKRFFNLAATYPKQLCKLIYPLIIIPDLLKGPDTSYEVRSCIEAFIPFLNNEEIEKIEEVIWETYKEDQGYTIAQSLSRIPADRIQLIKSKEFLEQRGRSENVPGITHHSSAETYTTDMWLEEMGVDLSDPVNKELSVLRNDLEVFNNQWLNHSPHNEVIEGAYEKLKTVLQKVKEAKATIKQELYDSVFRDSVKAAAILSKRLDYFKPEDVDFLKSVVKEGFQTVTQTDNAYEEENKSPSHGWGPTARIEAADALVNLYVYDQSPEIFQLFKEALNDKNGIVRYAVIKDIVKLSDKYYDTYWELITGRMKEEDDTFIYAGLIANLKFKPPVIQQQGIEVLEIIEAKSNLFSHRNSFIEQYAVLLLWLMSKHQVPMARQLLLDAYDKPELCRTVIFEVFEKAHPSWPENDYTSQPQLYEQKFSVVKHYVEKAGEELMSFQPEDLTEENKDVKYPMRIIDEVIMRIFFQLEKRRLGNSGHNLPVNVERRKAFYFLMKPIYQRIINFSSQIAGQGLITGHTAYYFIQSLNTMLTEDARDILGMINAVTKYSSATGYTFDSSAINEMVKLTEKFLADHRDLLMEDVPFQNLISLLDMYIDSGWVDALELLWKLDEVFR